MNVQEKPFKIRKLIEAFKGGSLARNPDYQRGEAWRELQKASFIDSIFRGYPVPALFFHETNTPGLEDEPSKKWEIVDGQQRLIALSDFGAGKYSLQPVNEGSKLRLPKSVRARPAPWAGKFFGDLAPDLRQKFEETEIKVFQIGSDALVDEVRDLFIRLQSGTALTRQQIRDAWPGNLGPFIERVAGKLDRRPAVPLFALVDKRGQRSEDEDQRDLRVVDRQICAQLLRIFLARERDPGYYPSVAANELDSLYHEYTDFDRDSTSATRFIEALQQAGDVYRRVLLKRTTNRIKVRRLEITALVMFLQDASKNENLKLNLDRLAQNIINSEGKERPSGKSTSGTTLETYYDWWRENIAVDIGIRLDERRAFDEQQKKVMREAAGGKCSVCGEAVDRSDEEYDHFPVAHRDGGLTEVSNGRLVHRTCHKRGRPTFS